jgi:hypothetical protein
MKILLSATLFLTLAFPVFAGGKHSGHPGNGSNARQHEHYEGHERHEGYHGDHRHFNGFRGVFYGQIIDLDDGCYIWTGDEWIFDVDCD